MTFFMGPFVTSKSTPIINEKPQEHVIRMRVINMATARNQLVVPARYTFLLVAGVVLLSMLVVTGVVLSVLAPPLANPATRYKGFCTIPIKDVQDEVGWTEQVSYKVMPLKWTAAAASEAVVPVTAGDDLADVLDNDLGGGLKEHFDIDDRIEKISVVDNGRRVNFIHDFDDNITGIVDTDRCFTMELDHSAVLAPALLVLSIEGGAPFDVSRVHASLRAALPALTAPPAALAPLCRHKPLYRLHRQETTVVKRSVDAPAHDYIQFSGRRVQEIDISNLADLLQHEQDLASLDT